jgi:dipeptidyl aminopeptidase/acylaminoacyl peptidase
MFSGRSSTRRNSSSNIDVGWFECNEAHHPNSLVGLVSLEPPYMDVLLGLGATMGRWLTLIFLLAMARPTLGDDATIDFKREVAPILVKRCLACHGPKKASAKFRVDTFARLMTDSAAGKNFEPGMPDDSLFFELIVENEPSVRMPKNADPLPEAEIKILRRWIEQGAKSGGLDPNADLASLVATANRPSAPAIYRTPVPIASLAFRPDGAELAIGGYREVTIWDPSTGKLLRRLPGFAQRIQGLTYSADGSKLVVAGGTPGEFGELALVDPNGGQPNRTLASSSDLFLGVAISPDGSLVACSGADRTLRVLEVASGKELCQIKQSADWVTGVAFDRDGVSVAASSADKLVKVFEARTGKLQTTYLGHGEPVLAVAFDLDSNKAVTAGADKKLHVWDPKVIAAEDGTAALLEDRFKKELSSKLIEGFGDDVLDLAVAVGQVFSASADGKVRQHDLKTSKLIRTFEGLDDWAYSLAIDPTGKRLAVGGFDGSVRVYEVETGREVVRFVAAPGFARP